MQPKEYRGRYWRESAFLLYTKIPALQSHDLANVKQWTMDLVNNGLAAVGLEVALITSGQED